MGAVIICDLGCAIFYNIIESVPLSTCIGLCIVPCIISERAPIKSTW